MLTAEQLALLKIDHEQMVEENERWSKLGPEFTHHGLERFTAQMQDDIRLLAYGKVDLPKNPRLGKHFEEEDFHYFPEHVGNRSKRIRPPLPEFKGVLRGNLDISRSYSNMFGGPKRYRDIEVTFLSGQNEQKVEWRVKNGDSNKTDVTVKYADPIEPTTQEEFLHAAQEIVSEHVADPEVASFFTERTTEQLVHSSYLMDLVLSAAALEMGPEEFLYWHNRANQQRDADKKATEGKQDIWPKTLLGKAVNTRFRYPQASPAYIGLRLKNLGVYFDDMYFDTHKSFLDQTATTFEVGALAYGKHHRDLTYSLIDCAADGQESGSLGRQAIEWGKAVLKYYKGSSVEAELVAHHSTIDGEIEPDHFNYEIPSKFIQYLKFRRSPTDYCSQSTLHLLGHYIWQDNVNAVTEAYFDNGQKVDSSRFQKALKDNGVSPKDFSTILAKARKIHNEQAIQREREVVYDFSEFESIMVPRRLKLDDQSEAPSKEVDTKGWKRIKEILSTFKLD